MTIRYGHRTRISQTNDCKIFFSKRIVKLYSKTEKILQVTKLCDVFSGSQINNDLARLVESPTLWGEGTRALRHARDERYRKGMTGMSGEHL